MVGVLRKSRIVHLPPFAILAVLLGCPADAAAQGHRGTIAGDGWRAEGGLPPAELIGRYAEDVEFPADRREPPVFAASRKPAAVRAAKPGRRGRRGILPIAETGIVPNEVLVEADAAISNQAIALLQRRHRLTPLGSHTIDLTNTRVFRWRISGRRSVAAVVRALAAEGSVRRAQPNYSFTLRGQSTPASAPAGSQPEPTRDVLR